MKQPQKMAYPRFFILCFIKGKKRESIFTDSLKFIK